MSLNAINIIKILDEYNTGIGSTLYIQLDIKYSKYVQHDSIYIFNGFLEHYKDQLEDNTYDKGKEWVEQLNKNEKSITMLRQDNELSFDDDIGKELDSQILDIFVKKLVNETKLNEDYIKNIMIKYRNDYIIINDMTESMRKSTKNVPEKTINSFNKLLNRHEKYFKEHKEYDKGKEWVKQLNKDNSKFTMSRGENELFFDEDIGKYLSNSIKISYINKLINQTDF